MSLTDDRCAGTEFRQAARPSSGTASFSKQPGHSAEPASARKTAPEPGHSAEPASARKTAPEPGHSAEPASARKTAPEPGHSAEPASARKTAPEPELESGGTLSRYKLLDLSGEIEFTEGFSTDTVRQNRYVAVRPPKGFASCFKSGNPPNALDSPRRRKASPRRLGFPQAFMTDAQGNAHQEN